MPRKSASKRSAKKKTAAKSGRRPGQAAHQRPATQRLQRVLASAGFGSRRQCEELIEAGRVEVDGTVVTRLGTTVDPQTSKVRVDGVPLKKQKLVYYAVNKPIGFVTTNRDPQGRPRVIDLVPPDERVFAVGRLDRNSEGLILLTNDGELAQKLTHPKFGVRKIYRVTVAGKVDPETMKQMRRGIHIAEGFVRVEGAKLRKARSRSTEMEIVLREGKNREIRRILARLGHKVQHLRRIAVGPLRLGDIPPGAYRVLSHQEVDKLWRATETSSQYATKKHGPGRQTRISRGDKQGRKKLAGRQRAEKPAQGKFAFDRPAVTGSVIGAETPADASTGPASGTGQRGTARRGGRKAAKRKPTVPGARNKVSAISGKRAASKRAGVKGAGGKRGAKRGRPGRKRHN